MRIHPDLDRRANTSWIAPLLLAAVVQVVGGEVVAGTVSDGEREHHRYCSCGSTCRKESCCCVPRASRGRPVSDPVAVSKIDTPSTSSTPLHLPADPRTNPCWAGVPCRRHPAAPGPHVVVPAGKSPIALLTRPGDDILRSSPLPSPVPLNWPSDRADRLERPPEA